jgi:hypothetical protein
MALCQFVYDNIYIQNHDWTCTSLYVYTNSDIICSFICRRVRQYILYVT